MEPRDRFGEASGAGEERKEHSEETRSIEETAGSKETGNDEEAVHDEEARSIDETDGVEVEEQEKMTWRLRYVAASPVAALPAAF
jgi:hypothetical protein